jgi:hypothetical protein
MKIIILAMLKNFHTSKKWKNLLLQILIWQAEVHLPLI